MSVDRLFNSPVSISGPQQVGRDRQGLERLKAADLAREFESMLLLQMLRQMRQSMFDDSTDEPGLSSATMLDVVDTELAQQLSKSGGFGLAEIMTQALQRQLPSLSPDAAAPGDSAGNREIHMESGGPPPTAADRRQGSGDVAGGIGRGSLTSDFGWRADPFTGGARYHQGIDVKAAYGQDVPAAGDGRVIEAGERGAYGLTVVLEHRDGLRTRYAHLSTAAVSVGDQVLQGQGIGRVGQSGRATGPHLHFEVIRGGKRIDPTTVVAFSGSGLGGLKLAGAVADFPIGGRAHTPATSGVDDED